MNRVIRVSLITESANLLARRHWSEIDTILEQFGCGTQEWFGDSLSYCLEMIKKIPGNDLSDIHIYLTGGMPENPTELQPWKEGNLKLFFSHLAKNREYVGTVKSFLGVYGIDAFVAHDNIKITDEWIVVIESALSTCDAAVAFLHDGFQGSEWCDQETGFVLARKVPLLSLMFDLKPYGFLGKYQAQRCIDKKGTSFTPKEVADIIVDWLSKAPGTDSMFTESLVGALETSPSWDKTRMIWRWLSTRKSFTPDQLRRLDSAAKANVDVREAYIGSSSAPELIKSLIAEQGTKNSTS